MAFTIGKFGLGSLVNLAELVGRSTSPRPVRAGDLGAVARLCGFSVVKLIVPQGRAAAGAGHLVVRIGPAFADAQDGKAGCSKSSSVWWCPPATPSTWTAPTST
jgi:hypothetical protein